MSNSTWTLTESDAGVLQVKTGVTGRASKLGHRLTIQFSDWTATVKWKSSKPAEVTLLADVKSLRVIKGDGGITPLSGPEKVVARFNALKTFDADKFPQILFNSTEIKKADDGFRLTGTLSIHGVDHKHVLDVQTSNGGKTLSCTSVVRQSDFGIKPYSQMLGAMKVTDDVTITFSVDPPEDV